MLRQLHWLPVQQRVDFELALLVYKALHDSTAAYLVDDCQLISHAGHRRLRSTDIDTCCVPRTNTQFGDRSFAAAGPRLWNSLPARIRQPDNGEFRRQLKFFYTNIWMDMGFCSSDTAAHSDFLILCTFKHFYSLTHSLTLLFYQ